jgi:hypothetical protein
MSGQGESVIHTANAANNTETFAMRSFREQSQTDRS